MNAIDSRIVALSNEEDQIHKEIQTLQKIGVRPNDQQYKELVLRLGLIGLERKKLSRRKPIHNQLQRANTEIQYVFKLFAS
ncbi:hypothetical protein ACFLYP_03495 [Chloroflexota bacterium]